MCCACGLAVVERLLNRPAEKRVRVLGSAVTLERFSSQPAAAESCSTPGRRVVVSELTPDVDVDTDLFPLLENKRKGGGKVEKAKRLAEDSVLVTFADESSMMPAVFTSCIPQNCRIIGLLVL